MVFEELMRQLNGLNAGKQANVVFVNDGLLEEATNVNSIQMLTNANGTDNDIIMLCNYPVKVGE